MDGTYHGGVTAGAHNVATGYGSLGNVTISRARPSTMRGRFFLWLGRWANSQYVKSRQAEILGRRSA